MASGCLAKKVYPRVCGGTPVSPAGYTDDQGLSPRVRGNRPLVERTVPRERSIPACAGEPSVNSLTVVVLLVYPRVCGGTIACPPHPRTGEGLSPRVRGNRQHRYQACPG